MGQLDKVLFNDSNKGTLKIQATLSPNYLRIVMADPAKAHTSDGKVIYIITTR